MLKVSLIVRNRTPSQKRENVRNMSTRISFKFAALAIVALAGMAVVYAVTTNYVSFLNTGNIKGIGVGVYTDSTCTQRVSTVDWGLLEGGTTSDAIVYVRNEGNAPVSLSLQTTNWNPSNANEYISLAWDYDGQQIGVNGVIAVVLSLSVASNVQGIPAFSFTVIIAATG